MIVSFFPPGGGQNKGFANWNDMGLWEEGLGRGRRDSFAGNQTKGGRAHGFDKQPLLEKMTRAREVRRREDIRYVAIELGIGGWQPHAAADIFTHHYGDCKDKATLLSTMLQEIGVDSYYIVGQHASGER